MECVLCAEAITNPICPACIQEGVIQWLGESGEYALIPKVEELTRNVFANEGDLACIKCESLMSLCAYCYTHELFHLIKDRVELLPRFLTYFNYDLGHHGWERDAESLVGVCNRN